MNIDVLLPSQFPSWEDTPSWVQSRAVDKNGTMWWFEMKPDSTFGEWFMVEKGKLEYVGYCDIRETWRSTLEERPDISSGNLT